MARDLLILAAMSIVFGVIVWTVLGNPQKRSPQTNSLVMDTSIP